MQCCGDLVEITEQDDPQRIYLCRLCGKQGPARDFPEPPPDPPDPPARWFDRVRLRVAIALDAMAGWIAPE